MCGCAGCNPTYFSLSHLHSLSFFKPYSVINFFHWLFRQTFTTVILTLSACFMLFALLFATGIFVYGIRNPECIVGVNFSETQYFTDAFILSWTTLSTCVRCISKRSSCSNFVKIDLVHNHLTFSVFPFL